MTQQNSALQADNFPIVNSVAPDSGTVASDEAVALDEDVYITVVGKVTLFKVKPLIITITLDNAAISPIQVSATAGSDPEQGTYFVTATSVSILLTSTNISTRLRPALVNGVACEIRYLFIPNAEECPIKDFTVGTQHFPLTI